MLLHNFFVKPIIRSIFLHLFVRKKIKWLELASTVLKRRHRFENSLKYTNIWYYLDMNKNTQIFWKLKLELVTLWQARQYSSYAKNAFSPNPIFQASNQLNENWHRTNNFIPFVATKKHSKASRGYVYTQITFSNWGG